MSMYLPVCSGPCREDLFEKSFQVTVVSCDAGAGADFFCVGIDYEGRPVQRIAEDAVRSLLSDPFHRKKPITEQICIIS